VPVGTGRGVVLHTLRERVLRGTLGVLAFGIPAISVVIVLGSLRAGTFDPLTVVLSLYTLSFPALRLLYARLGVRVSAVLLLGLLALTAFFVEARGGAGPGNILLNGLVILLCTLFFGRRGALIGLLAVVGLFVLAGWLVVTGKVPPVTRYMWDPSLPTFWLRGAIAFVLVGLAVVVVQTYIVERLVSEAHRLQELVDHEQHQREALQTAEREREAERTQRLHAQRALEESRRIEALARMAGGIAHDFNNSLTVIMGAAEEVGLARSLDEANARSRDIVQAARQSAELTRQLLTLGRRQILQSQAVVLGPLFERLQVAFRRILPSDISLEVDGPYEALVAHADPAELERALFNLVLNARDAMPQGGRLHVQCSDRSVSDGEGPLALGRYVEIAVSDSGQGIPPDIIDRIFEPFFTTKPAGVGTGLGLATVHAFAREAGGDLCVTSHPGMGATFTLSLPASTRGAEAAESALRTSSAALVAVPSETRVLVVEDNAIVRGNIARVLRAGGFLVNEAADGAQALSQVEAQPDFAVMCIDGVMPGLSTREVIERVERRCPSLRVLLCSGYLQEDLLRRGVATGRFAFLGKPFSSKDLLSAVRGLVGVVD
jgi:signal transduction histidine kinase